jgi:hypothetical protein
MQSRAIPDSLTADFFSHFHPLGYDRAQPLERIPVEEAAALDTEREANFLLFPYALKVLIQTS